MSRETQQRDKRKVLEDVFEAFIGCLENIVDQSLNMHSGYGVCYTIISTILDVVPISLKETDLKGPKTRLKEIFDKSSSLNNLVYEVKEDRVENNMFGVQAVGIINGKKMYMGYGRSNIKRQAEKKAAQESINWLTEKKII
jgi:dsRNA-specific ribonuclease